MLSRLKRNDEATKLFFSASTSTSTSSFSPSLHFSLRLIPTLSSSSRARGEDSAGSEPNAPGGGGGGGSAADAITTLAGLLSTPTSELLRRPQAGEAPRPILCLDPSTTVGDALAALAARRVLSAPVRTLEAAATAARSPVPEGTTKEFAEASRKAAAEGRDFVCFVDVRDVLMSFLEVIPPGSLEGAKLLKRAKVLEEAGSKLSEMPLSSLPVIGSDGAFLFLESAAAEGAGADRGADGGDADDDKTASASSSAAAAAAASPAALDASMPLRSLLSGFLVGGSSSSSSNGSKSTAVSVVRQGEFPRARAAAHRVALLSPPPPSSSSKQRVTHIVSQLDAARFVLKHAAALGPLALKTAAELGAFFFFLFFFLFFPFFSFFLPLKPLSLVLFPSCFPLFRLLSSSLPSSLFFSSQAGPTERS